MTSEHRKELIRFLKAHGVPLNEIPRDTSVRTDGETVFLERYRKSCDTYVVDSEGVLLRDEIAVKAISPVLIPAWIDG